MRIAMIEDQAEDRARARKLCEEWARENGAALSLEEYAGGEAFLAALLPGRFDLAFLDIYMGGLSGLETARRLRQIDRACLLVFLTGSREHMAQAFPFHTFDYLEKPASRERIFSVLSDALALLPEKERCLALPGTREERIALDTLVSAETAGNYLLLSRAEGDAIRCRMTFTELSRRLEGESRFLSPIRGVIVNMDYIEDLGAGRCLMKTGAVFPVKLRDGAALEAALNRYRFDRLRTRQERGKG